MLRLSWAVTRSLNRTAETYPAGNQGPGVSFWMAAWPSTIKGGFSSCRSRNRLAGLSNAAWFQARAGAHVPARNARTPSA